MAPSFSNIKLSLLLTSKGYAVAASGGGKRGDELSTIMMKKLIKGRDELPKSTWLPDPVTGDYRPENQTDQIDAVDLRRMLLKNNFTGH